MNDDLIIKVEHVSKQYRLGAIGGTTLKEDLQRFSAKIRHKEDPTAKIGQETDEKHIGEIFYALNDVSFEIKKGEAVGIIGGNGAGKSTLLKLLSRVTAPTEGQISYDGRITSMLEVGTGFHPELTGRENIYMNGAILGMTKSEIRDKIEEIIDFSEVREFIDTPVKRYSSGMYVKLAFSVASHLDSEIMIMDEVLAVGDMAFQKKCLDKMRDAANNEGKTILYVSHNMNTIRQLCDRCIVLDKGHKVFEGDVEEAISIYSNKSALQLSTDIDCKNLVRTFQKIDHNHQFTRIKLLNKERSIYEYNEDIIVSLEWNSKSHVDNLAVRITLFDSGDNAIGMLSTSPNLDTSIGDCHTTIKFNLDKWVGGTYKARVVLYSVGEFGADFVRDVLDCGFVIQKKNNYLKSNNMEWNSKYWGYYQIDTISAGEYDL